jgi:hypothetical protein
MLREAKLTSGIGARTAHNIQWLSTKDAMIDRILTSALNAKQRKTTKIVQHKDLTTTLCLGVWEKSPPLESKAS